MVIYKYLLHANIVASWHNAERSCNDCIQLTAAALLIVALATGCVSAPTSDSGLAAVALSLTPPEGMAGVYVLGQPAIFGGGRNFPEGGGTTRGAEQKITLNGAAFGTITHGYYIYGWVQPGLHTISAEVKNHDAVPTEFEALAGKNYFFRYRSYAYDVTFIFPVAFYTALHPVDEEDAVYRLQRLKLSAINVFESEKQ